MILSALFGASSTRPPEDDFWYSNVGPMTRAGVRIDGDTAMRISAVFGCVRIISETLGSLPLITYRRLDDGGKERAPKHWAYDLLHHRPNAWQTTIEFIEMMTAHCVLRGNAYAYIDWANGGLVEQLVPLHPDRVRIDDLPNGRMLYRYQNPVTKVEERYVEDEIFHLRGLSLDGRLGLSVIGYQRETMGLTLAAQEYGSRFFANDATPRLVLKHGTHFEDKGARDRFRSAWREQQIGGSGTAVLEDGMDIKTLGISNEDAQFLETRKYQVADVARIFRVPLVLLQETEKSTSWGTGIEQFMLAAVIHCFRPWAVRWEQAIGRDFLDATGGDDSGEYFAEFLLSGLLRGDQKSRYEAYASGISAGWLVRNEARIFENLNPLPGLWAPLSPLNMGQPGQQRQNPPPADEELEEEEAAARLIEIEVAAAQRMYEHAFRTKDLGAWRAWIQRFYGLHQATVVAELVVPPALARSWCDSQSAELDAATEADLEDSRKAVPPVLAGWAATGAARLLKLKRGEACVTTS